MVIVNLDTGNKYKIKSLTAGLHGQPGDGRAPEQRRGPEGEPRERVGKRVAAERHDERDNDDAQTRRDWLVVEYVGG